MTGNHCHCLHTQPGAAKIMSLFEVYSICTYKLNAGTSRLNINLLVAQHYGDARVWDKKHRHGNGAAAILSGCVWDNRQ